MLDLARSWDLYVVKGVWGVRFRHRQSLLWA